MLQNPHVLLTFEKVHNPLCLPRETTSERPKVVRAFGALNIFTSKCASRHNGVHFFDISTSKSGLNVVCFVHFDLEMRHKGVHFFNIATSKSGPNLVCLVHFGLEMCFAPQRRELFRHHNFQKCSCALYILTWKCASRHNGVHFFNITTSKSGPNMVCFVHFDLEMRFAPQRRAIVHLSSSQLAPHLRL